MLKWSGVALVLPLLLAAGVLVDWLRRGGAFSTLRPHFAGTCQSLPLAASAEYIQIDRARGLAYLSYLDRRAQLEGRQVLGTIMVIDPTAQQPHPRAALNFDPPDFRPQGLSLYVPAGGPRRLFVISDRPHAASDREYTVEILEQGPNGSFTPVETIRDPLLFAPHALLAVGPRQFYVVNDSGAHSGLDRTTERVLRRGLSSLGYFDGKAMRALVRDLASGTGIAGSTDGRNVYVSESLAHRINVYARDAASGALTRERHIDLASAPDAIVVDEHGNLWIAAHPRQLALWRHLAGSANPTPTQVLRISPIDWEPVEVYLNRGEEFSAGGVAAVLGKTLLVGSITERRLLRCALP
jgi:arylesterase / paraoxonase